MTAPAPVFPNAQETAVNLLRAALAASPDPAAADVVVLVEMPVDPGTGQPSRPARCVQVRRDGGARDFPGVVDSAIITCRVWHDTEYQAERLAQLCRSALLDPPLTVPVTGGTARPCYASDQAAPIPVTDPADGMTTSYFLRTELRLRAL